MRSRAQKSIDIAELAPSMDAEASSPYDAGDSCRQVSPQYPQSAETRGPE